MFRKLARAMAGHYLGHDFLLHKTPRPIACRALVVCEELFYAVVIQRCHVVQCLNFSFQQCYIFSRFWSAKGELIRIMEIAPGHGTTSRVSRQSDSCG